MDELGREYLLVALGIGRLQDGIVDSYYGPPELRTEADSREATAAQLAGQAAELRARLADEPDVQRQQWLDRQLVALETLARRLDGKEIGYLEEVERCFDARPEPTPRAVYDAVHRRLDDLLAPGPDLRRRVEQRSERLTVPADRLAPIVEWLIAEIRRDCLRHFAAPVGESLTVSLVTGEPWSAYNWYDGGLRSRIEVNTDLPLRAPEMIGLMTHECFPGHHLEHAWKEQRLYRELGRVEASVLLINTPEAYVSEGVGELGGKLVVEDGRWQELFEGICRQAGIPLEPGEAARQREISRALGELRSTSADASLLLHAEQRPGEEVIEFVERTALTTAQRAAKTLEFISHPLWRTYVFCYSGGERLLADWCAAAGDLDAQRGRFFRLLTEQLTPSALRESMAPANS